MTLVFGDVEIVEFNVMDWAHCPRSGVNVYASGVVVLTTEGFQLPEMPF